MRVSRYTWRLGLSEFGNAIGGRNCANLQAVMELVWRYLGRPWSSELGGRNQASLDQYLEVVNGRRTRC